MSCWPQGEIVSVEALRQLSFCQGTTGAPARSGEQSGIVFCSGGAYGWNMPTL